MERKGPPTLKSIEEQLENVLEGLAAMRAGARAAGIDLDAPSSQGEAPGKPAGPSKREAGLQPVAGVGGVPVLSFPVTGPGGPTWSLGADQVADWMKLFPGVDVLAECRKALAWIQANPKKTAKGMPRFLVSWITRAVNKGDAARLGVKRGEAPPTGALTPGLKARQEREEAARQRAIETIRALEPGALEELKQEAIARLAPYQLAPDVLKAKIKSAMIQIVIERDRGR